MFLKLDGQRIPVTAAYEPATEATSLHPTVTLNCSNPAQCTHARRDASDGTPLPEGVFFQFTTNSLWRHPIYDYPVEGALEGPWARYARMGRHPGPS
mgnify:CR=1 FL=1